MASGDSPLPSGTVTMLFTDVEGSTRLLEGLGPDRYAEALMVHREQIREVGRAHRGVEMGTEGDAFFFVFQSAADGLAAAGEMQLALGDGPLRVRIGVHTGEVLLADGDYVGMAVHKAARISSAAHGGQVVVSAQTGALAGIALRDLGEHRLKDLTAPERLFQLGDGEFPPLRTLRRGHLPVQATPLIGRERELGELVALAETHRLITLTGTGGTGKTRLALALAAELADSYADGAWWVPMATVTDPSLLTPAIAGALGDIEDVATYLGGRSLLLVIDNMEQVIDAAPLIGQLLADAPECAVIVTSRERLAVDGEQEYPVPPLSPHDAAELFIARAREVKPGFAPGTELDAICERLDRLPLALELAATRVKVLSEHQLLTRLEQRLPLLAGGRRDLPQRQSTMRAAIAWSYDLLSEAEQELFTRLAVFVGSFELEAAEEICDASLDELQSLVDKSLVRQSENGRFFLLETTREYALERFVGSAREPEIRARHAHWHFALGVAACGRDPERTEAQRRLRADAGNISLALSWALEHDAGAALPLADSLHTLWVLAAGRTEELIRWYERALEDDGVLTPRGRADALRGLGMALVYAEAPDPARDALSEALALYRKAGDELNEARVLNYLGAIEFVVGSPAEVLRWCEQALAISERLDDPEGLARSLQSVAEARRDTGEYERAAELYSRSIDIRRARGLGDGEGAVHSLGDLSLDSGDPSAADVYYREALALSFTHEDQRLRAYCLAGLACVAARAGDAHTAGRLWTLAERIEHALGFRMLAAERVRYERILAPPLADSDDYRSGVAEAADTDPHAAAVEILGSTTPQA
jgi:predicted ATPase/class 3 adenylate cyclase